MNTDILGISELKWMGMGEFNSDGHYIYYCGKESLKNRVALTVNRGSAGKESACNVGNLGSVPGLGRSPGEGKGYQLQYSGLENSTDCLVYGVTKSWIQLSNLHFHCHSQQKSPKCSACVHAKSLQS